MTNAVLTTTQHLGVDPFAAINRARLAKSTKRQYLRQIELYLEAGLHLTDAEALADYARGLKSSPQAFLKAAIRVWTKAVARHVKANSTPQTVNAVMATLHRLDSLNDAITVEQQKGTRIHTWLSGSQVKHLREVVIDRRDYLIISLMLACGLRREEVVTLKSSEVMMMGSIYVLSVTGKGDKTRTIPITPALAEGLTAWANGELLFPLSGQAVMDICRKYGQMIDVPQLAPHDLRRTFAQCCLDNGVELPKISKLLGHSSINTTARYLNLDEQNLPTVGEFMQF